MGDDTLYPCTFRIDHLGDAYTDEYHEKLITDFLSSYEKYIIFREISKEKQKVHWQGIVWSHQKPNTFKTYANKFFDKWKGGQRRSFAPVKKVKEYMSYIFKDGDVRMSKGYSEDDISTWMQISQEKTEEIEKKRKPRVSFTQNLLRDFDEWFQKQPKGEDLDYIDDADDMDDELNIYAQPIKRLSAVKRRDKIIEARKHIICDWTLAYFNENSRIFDGYIINRFNNLLMYRYYPDYRISMRNTIVQTML